MKHKVKLKQQFFICIINQHKKNICNFGVSKIEPYFYKNTLKALHRTKLKILFALSFTVFINTFSFAQDIPKKAKPITPKEDKLIEASEKDKDTLKTDLLKETLQDTIKVDTLKPKKKDFLENIVDYQAKGYTLLKQKKQKIYLYDEADVTYGDLNIKAGDITIDYKKNEVYARGIVDSSGTYTQAPIFDQAGNIVKPDSILFNTKTKKALIYNSITEQEGGTIIANITKKENDSVYFIKNANYTTAENLDDPEYYIKLRKAKVVPGKKIVTGLANLFIYDVPTPIGVPFAFFPQSKKQTSGILIPTFGEQNTRGYFLQNGGYYFAISDYIDLELTGDYYTNGSYGIRAESAYAVRYKFRGNIGFRFENLITSERGFPDFSRNRVYNLRWTHSQDGKASPNSRFSASVNLGSSTFYRQSLNQLTTGAFLNNTLASSVSYSKTFQGEPQVDFSLTATHSQNTQTETINMTLPTFQGNVGRIFPFAPKTGSKKGALQNINFQYNVRGENRIQTTDSEFFTKEMFRDAKTGFQHSIPLSTNFKVFKHFSISASTNYNEVWTFNTIDRRFDFETRETITDTIRGFDSYRTYNFNANLGTTIYGMFNFEKKGEDKKIKAIRHVIRPSINYNINPAFDRFYDSYETEVITADGVTRDDVEFTRFEQSLFGAPSRRFSSTMGFTISNNIEAKVRDKDSTKTEPKKIKLLNNLNFSTAYNFAGDSLQWSPVRLNGGTQLFNNELNVNFGATLDPYALDNNNQRINTFNINNGGSLFRLTSANLNLSYNLSSDSGKKKKEDTNDDQNFDENVRNGGRDDDLFGVSENFADTRRNSNNNSNENEDSEFYNFKIPWKLRLAYVVNYSNQRRNNEISSHSLMFSGDVELSPKWNIGVSSGYDFKNQGFTFTQFRFGRDLLSWKMDFSWVPFGPRGNWNFFIGIKSNLLSDLKYEQRRQPDQILR